MRKQHNKGFLYFRKNQGRPSYIFGRIPEGPYQRRWFRFSPGDTRKHPGGTQEAPRKAPRGTQGTPEAPGGLGGNNWYHSQLECKSSLKMLILPCVFEGPSQIHCYLQWNLLRHSVDVPGNPPRPLIQHRKNPYSWRLFGELNPKCTNVL